MNQLCIIRNLEYNILGHCKFGVQQSTHGYNIVQHSCGREKISNHPLTFPISPSNSVQQENLHWYKILRKHRTTISLCNSVQNLSLAIQPKYGREK